MIACDDDGVLLGVCAAVAKRVNLDTSIVRILFLLGLLFAGLPVIVYPVLWLIFKIGDRE